MANGGHYILATHVTQDFFPPIHLEWKKLREARNGWAFHRGDRSSRLNVRKLARMSCSDGEFQPERPNHANDGAKFRIAFLAQSFVKAFPG
jgi:hypothetical protein